MQPLLVLLLLLFSHFSFANVTKKDFHIQFVAADQNHLYPYPIKIRQPGNSWLMYPVPAGDVLNLRYQGVEPIRGVINVLIRHINGRIFHKLRFASTTRQIQIPVNNLGAGIYEIKIMVNDEIIWNQRFVK
jgi:hypothetical protein